MYLAQTNTLQTQAPFYVKILEDIIAGNNFSEKENVDIAINEAIEVANENKDLYAINNNHYFFVTTLLSKYKDKLLQLHSNQFNQATYNDILEILK